MERDNLKAARDLFIRYNGSHFQMEREGKLDYYRTFHVSDEQEKWWIKEYIEESVEQISTVDNISLLITSLCTAISQYNDVDGLMTVVVGVRSKVSDMDSFSKIRISEEVLKTIEKFKKRKLIGDQIILDVKEIMLDILYSVVNNPVTIAPVYRNLNHLKAIISEENIILRARDDIGDWKKILTC